MNIFKALEENNIPLNEKYIKYCKHGGMIKEEIYEAINELFSLDEKPDAILTASDRLSTATLGILSKMNIKYQNRLHWQGLLIQSI